MFDALKNHPWKVRFGITGLMLLLSLIGLILTSVRKDGAWEYWRIMTPVFALLSLGMSVYLRKLKEVLSPVTVWHELLHWVGLFAATMLIAEFVKSGIMGRMVAGLQVVTLLALTMYTLGIYVESSFMIIGILLGIFAACAAIISEYLFIIAIPLVAIAGAAAFFLIKRKKKEPPQNMHHHEQDFSPHDDFRDD